MLERKAFSAVSSALLSEEKQFYVGSLRNLMFSLSPDPISILRTARKETIPQKNDIFGG